MSKKVISSKISNWLHEIMDMCECNFFWIDGLLGLNKIIN